MRARMFRWSWVGKTQKRVLHISRERSPSLCVLLEAGGQGSEEGLWWAKGHIALDCSFKIRGLVASAQSFPEQGPGVGCWAPGHSPRTYSWT